MNPLAQEIGALHRANRRSRLVIMTFTAVCVFLLFSLTLMVGNKFVSPHDVAACFAGRCEPSTYFAVIDLRLPRATLALFAGAAFGLAGTTFQTMLRNPLASPDIIGITSGASTAAVFAIVILGTSQTLVSVFALVGALGTALAIFTLSNTSGFAGFRMILIGIGFAALLNSLTQWMLSRTPSWDLQTAMRWLSGSVSSAAWRTITPLIIATALFGSMLFLLRRQLDLLRLGDDAARGLGVRVDAARLGLIVAAVALLAFATAAAGPIAFVAFMSGPIAARVVGSGRPPLTEAALIGAIIVLAGDLVAQNAFAVHYPVGVITGLLGAPFLLVLLMKLNKGGGNP